MEGLTGECYRCKIDCLEELRLQMKRITPVAVPPRSPVSKAAAPHPSYEELDSSTLSRAAASCSFGRGSPFLRRSSQPHLSLDGCCPSHCIHHHH